MKPRTNATANEELAGLPPGEQWADGPEGEVPEVNPLLETEPEKVNTDPYGEGWMIKMKVDNPADVNSLMDAAAYQKVVA